MRQPAFPQCRSAWPAVGTDARRAFTLVGEASDFDAAGGEDVRGCSDELPRALLLECALALHLATPVVAVLRLDPASLTGHVAARPPEPLQWTRSPGTRPIHLVGQVAARRQPPGAGLRFRHRIGTDKRASRGYRRRRGWRVVIPALELGGGDARALWTWPRSSGLLAVEVQEQARDRLCVLQFEHAVFDFIDAPADGLDVLALLR
jgi:hypothetical protein